VRLDRRGDLALLVFDGLAAAGLSCLHSTAELDVRSVADRRRLVAAAGFDPDRYASPVQVHGATIVRVDAPRTGVEADGLVTDVPGLALLLKAADCSLVVVADPRRRAVGVAHAGWRGAAAGIVESLVRAMGTEFDVPPARLVAGVGPTIGARRYAVGAEVLDAFRARVPWADEYASRIDGALHFDLSGANARALRECGVPADAIEVAPFCTHERADLLHSYRRSGTGTGHHGLVAGWRQGTSQI